jgi:uncharacterized protein Yka (UPF0111/DUF47 family)
LTPKAWKGGKMAVEQLSFFQKTEIELLEDRMVKCENSSDAVRKGTFHKISTIAKTVESLKTQIDEMQMQLYILGRCVE